MNPFFTLVNTLVEILWKSCGKPVENSDPSPPPFDRHTFLNPPPLKKKNSGSFFLWDVENLGFLQESDYYV
jgi:hypothetical protein